MKWSECMCVTVGRIKWVGEGCVSGVKSACE